MKKIGLLNLFLLLLSLGASAQRIVEVLPLTDRIVMVHVNEGTITRHQLGGRRGDDVVNRTAMNVPTATALGTYQISSTDDAAYSTAKNPVDLGRKSKGTDFAFLCQGWGPNGCVNTDADHVKDHWLYLYLPTPMQRGKTYTINTGSIATNGSTWPITFDEKSTRSEAVHVNQIGYKPNAGLKFGYVYHWLGDKGGLDLTSYAGTNFSVINTANNTVAFTGKLVFRKGKTNAETGQSTDTPNQNFASADVYECNFSGLTTPGTYVLAVDGIGRSFPFVINANAPQEPFNAVMNGLYKNRSGIALTAGTISDQNRPAPHNPNLTPGFANRLFYTTARDIDYVTDGGNATERAATKAAFEAGKQGAINTYGWYQDAGDWDGYFSHTHVPMDLLFLYEQFPAKFTDNALKLPETGNNVPDLLDEARWLLRYFHRTRQAVMANNWPGAGGVGGARVMGDFWGGDETPSGNTKASWTDTDRDWYVSGADVWTTYRYAGMAAQFAYALSLAGATDPEGINWQQEAIDAYTWAQANQTTADETVRKGYNLKGDRLYAAAQLYRLTGTAAYHTQFQTDAAAVNINGASLEDDLRFGLWTYLRMPATRTTNATLLQTIRSRAEAVGDDMLLGSADKRAARWGGDFFFPMLVGQGTSPMVTQGIMAYDALKTTNPTKANDYLKVISATSDYFLGNNPLNQTWITGLGERSPREIFHMDSWYAPGGNNGTRTGIVPYGPWRTSNPRPAQIGWWDVHWPEQTLYPAGMDNWPGHERWFEQRPSPLSAEFTVHQTMRWSAVAYGFLSAVEEPPFQNIPVTGLTVTPASLTVVLGRTASATATVQPSNATNPGVNWSSINPVIASVAADGTITGVAVGNATVTATTVDGNFSQTVDVQVLNVPVTGVTANPTSLTVRVGRSSTITATVQPANATNTNVTWSSSDTAIATVSNTGSVSGVAEGTATITVRTVDGNFSQAIAVTVGALTVFTCPGNIAVNGGFEEATLSAGASATNTAYQAFPPEQAQLVSDAASGVQAVRLGITADGYMHQIIFNPAIKRYTLKVKIKRAGNTSYAGFKLAFQNAAGTELTGTQDRNVTNTEYQELTIGPVVAPPTTDKLFFQFYVGGGSLYIDDLCVTAEDIADTQPPTAPTNLSATALSQSVQLTWTASTDNVAVTRYDVFQNGSKIGESTSPAFSATGLTAGTSYTFTVKAVDAANNESDLSAPLSVTTLLSDPRYVLNPTDDKDNDGNGTRATVNYSQFTNAYYKFNLTGVTGTPTRAILRLNKTGSGALLGYLGIHADNQDSWTETGTTNPQNATTIATRAFPAATGAIVEFDVTNYITQELGAGRNKIASFQLNANIGSWQSIGAKENTGAKPELIITTAAFTDSQAPTAPTGLTATEVAQGGFRLSWAMATDNVGVTGYEVFSGATKLTTTSADAYTYLVKGLAPATAYSFTVRAIDGAGNGTSSAALPVTTAALSQTSVTLGTTDDTGNPDNAIGTAPYATLSQWNNAFTRFDLANVQGTVSAAKLRLYSGSALTYTLKQASTKTWSEGNQSALPSPTGDVLKTVSGTSNSYTEFDVTDLVQAGMASDKILSWAINHTAGNWQSFSTKEAPSNKPQLVITLAAAQTVATPTFAGLPASGLACAGTSLTLTAACATGTVQWQGTPQGTVSGASIIVPATAGMYSYSALCQSDAISSSVVSTSVTINASPTAPALSNVSRTVTQSNTPLSLTQFVVATGTLSFSGINGLLNPPTVPISSTGTQSFTVTQASVGCVSPATAFTITVQAVAPPTQPGNQTVCAGTNSVVNAGINTSGATYQWYRNGISVANQLTETPSVRGTKTVSLTLVGVQTTANYYCKVTVGSSSTMVGPIQVRVVVNCGGRVSAEVTEPTLRVELAPNPLANGRLRAIIGGAEGKPLTVRLYTAQGFQLREQHIERADASVLIDWDMQGQASGLLLLQATTPDQRKTVKVINP